MLLWTAFKNLSSRQPFLVPAFRRQRQAEHCQLKASLVYIAGFKMKKHPHTHNPHTPQIISKFSKLNDLISYIFQSINFYDLECCIKRKRKHTIPNIRKKAETPGLCGHWLGPRETYYLHAPINQSTRAPTNKYQAISPNTCTESPV